MKPAIELLQVYQPLVMDGSHPAKLRLLFRCKVKCMNKEPGSIAAKGLFCGPVAINPDKGEGAQVQQYQDEDDAFQKPYGSAVFLSRKPASRGSQHK